MFKRITLITLLTITTTINYSLRGIGEEATHFEIGKIVTTDETTLIPYPGGNLYKLSSPKKIIVRRTDGTLKYGIALRFWAPSCDTPTLFTLVNFDKTSQIKLFKSAKYEDIYLLSTWLIKKDSPNNPHDAYEWSSEAEADTILNEIKQ
jgi:hypothetical protein